MKAFHPGRTAERSRRVRANATAFTRYVGDRPIATKLDFSIQAPPILGDGCVTIA
jgi:hypothetical protein